MPISKLWRQQWLRNIKVKLFLLFCIIWMLWISLAHPMVSWAGGGFHLSEAEKIKCLSLVSLRFFFFNCAGFVFSSVSFILLLINATFLYRLLPSAVSFNIPFNFSSANQHLLLFKWGCSTTNWLSFPSKMRHVIVPKTTDMNILWCQVWLTFGN